MSDHNQIGLDEFYEAMKAAYPDQTARVIAELRATKADAKIAELQEALDTAASSNGDGAGTVGTTEAAKEEAARAEA